MKINKMIIRRSTFIFIVLSAFASALNYAIYPALSRVLNESQFVSITVSLALFTQLSSFMLTIVALTIGLSKESGKKDSNAIIEKLQAVLVHFFILVIFVYIATSPLYISKIQIPTAMLFPISFMLALSIPMSILSGYLNGKQKLVKLGVAIALSAVLQFILSLAFGIATRSGFVALSAMAGGALIAIVIIYRIFNKENLPRVSSVFSHKLELYRSTKMRSLIIYTVLTSCAAIAVNVSLIIDLLVVNARQVDSVIYTDIYIVSRIVFFSGMLFIWPFLSKIDLYDRKKNTALLYQLMGLFGVICVSAMSIMLIFGQEVTRILLGYHETSRGDIKQLAILAILYKFLFLVITALTFYFIVIRSYWAILLPFFVAGGIGFFILTLDGISSTQYIITGLNAVAAIGTIFGLYGLSRVEKNQNIN